MCGIKFVEKDMYAIIKYNQEKDARTAITHYNNSPFCFTPGCKEKLKIEKYAHQDHVQVDDQPLNQEFESELSRVHNDLKILSENSKLLFDPLTLDLMFIMDCTSSMTPWI